MRPLVHQADRLTAILEEISSDGTVEVADLAGRLDVSAATIRRDLERLEEQRLLTRTHGGAVSHGVLYELPLRYKSARHHEEKRRIARAVAARVADGVAIGLTGGTTCTEVARELVDRERLTVVTNALNIASELAIRPEPQAGGDRRRRPARVLRAGRPAGRAVARRVEPRSGRASGSTASTRSPAARPTTRSRPHTDLALIERARRVVVVADSSKIGRVAFARICPVERVDELITDRGADARALRAIRQAGVSVETV